MAPAGSPPMDLPPVHGWTDGVPYVIARQKAESRFNAYIQAFGCVLLVSFGLCHVAARRRTNAQEAAQQRRRIELIQTAEFRRTGRSATRERELAEEAAKAEAWEASWLFPFWHMGEEATGIPKLVQVIQPGDVQRELGVVLLEQQDWAGVPLERDPGEREQLPPQHGGSDGQHSNANAHSDEEASTVDVDDIATQDDLMDNPLYDAEPGNDSLGGDIEVV